MEQGHGTAAAARLHVVGRKAARVDWLTLDFILGFVAGVMSLLILCALIVALLVWRHRDAPEEPKLRRVVPADEWHDRTGW